MGYFRDYKRTLVSIETWWGDFTAREHLIIPHMGLGIAKFSQEMLGVKF
jgi:hypothetical protein